MFIRVGRMPVPDVTPRDDPFERGTVQSRCDGSDVAIIANGTMVSRALAAAEPLGDDGIEARVLKCRRIEPLDVDAVLAAAGRDRRDRHRRGGNVAGGLGGAVAEIVAARDAAGADAHPRLPRQFAPTGCTDFLLDYFGLTADGIVDGRPGSPERG